jgi:hypothetical protein
MTEGRWQTAKGASREAGLEAGGKGKSAEGRGQREKGRRQKERPARRDLRSAALEVKSIRRRAEGRAQRAKEHGAEGIAYSVCTRRASFSTKCMPCVMAIYGLIV